MLSLHPGLSAEVPGGEVRLSPSLAGTPAQEAARECQEQDSQEAKHRLESAELGARWEAM